MRKLLKHLFLLGAAALLAAVAFLAVLDYLVMPYIVDVPAVYVPRLKGMSVRQAERQLRRARLGERQLEVEAHVRHVHAGARLS